MTAPAESGDSAGMDSSQLPEELPPVTPPSAGFVVQLFVVPALIVLAVVGVWLLFGHIASSEEDWQQQVVELKNPNPHRRWRAAHGLAQMLKADRERSAEAQRLTLQPELARSLADGLLEELKSSQTTEAELSYRAFLTRTLGLFDLPEIVLPALLKAVQADQDREVRKNALSSIALVAYRQSEAGHPWQDEAGIANLIGVSTDTDPLIRQLTAYTLGLFPTPASLNRLAALLQDQDYNTQANAAIALARNHDLRALPVIQDLLSHALDASETGSPAEYERFVTTKNALTAVGSVAEKLNPVQRAELQSMLEKIAEQHKEPKLAIEARAQALKLQAVVRPKD